MLKKLQYILLRVVAVVVLTMTASLPAMGDESPIAITPTSINPSEYASLSSLLPSDFWNTVYQDGKQAFDRLFISVQFDAATASVLGFDANTPYILVFDANINQRRDSTPGREQWYIYLDKFKPSSNTIYSIGYMGNNKTYYYSSTYYPVGMTALFGLPYIAPSGIEPSAVSSVLTPKLPSDYLSDIFASSKATMDYLYTAMRFTSAEAAAFSSMGFTLPADEDILFGFSKVVCSDGNNYYVPTTYRPTASSNFVLSDLDNRKLYFTGNVTSAYAGDTTSSEGFFYLKGKDKEKVDIYLRDYKVQSVQSKDMGELDLRKFMLGSQKGMAAPFAIGTSGEQTDGNIFTVNFHIKGDNLLTGGAVSRLSSSNAIYQILAEIVEVHAAPIAIRPIGESTTEIEYRSCCLNFDDHFPAASGTVATNGKLSLPVAVNRDAPSIDLGNRFGRCTFNGGQYQLTTAGNSSMFYVASMAICYRAFELMGTKNYGVGTSVATPDENTGAYPTVHILDGTFSTYSAAEFKSTVDVVAHGWYHDYTDLRLPIKTRIDGGTFNNCKVYACDASAEQGKTPVNTAKEALCRIEKEVSAPDAQGLSVLDLSATNPDYGTASLTPVLSEGKYYVYPYLPGDCDTKTTSYTHNYVSVIPLMGVKNLLTMGGNIKVESNEADGTPRENAFFFYTRLNEYTKKNAYVTLAGYPATVGAAITLAGNHEYSEVTNANEYEIAHGLYAMLSFNSNQWYTICPPYDVHNVYVVETLPDDSLSSYGLTATDKGTDKYLEAQGTADGVLAQAIVTSLLPDILSGKGSGVYMDLIEICRQTIHLNPTLLTHYNPTISGHGAAVANYYLYEQVDDEGDELGYSGMWKAESDIDAYSQKWKYAVPTASTAEYTDKDGNTRAASEIVMQKGKNYSIFLPAGNDDYWTGKYLIFEGYGPQTIGGKNALDDLITSESGFFDTEWMAENDPDSVFYLQGNSTFANDTTNATTGRVFIPDTQSKTHNFVRKDLGHIVKPWETMLVMSPNNTTTYSSLSALSASAARAVAAYDTSLPTVMSNTLFAFNRHGILLQTTAAQAVSVYTVDGLQIWKNNMQPDQAAHIDVPTGVYLVQGAWQTIKLIVTE